MKLNSLFKNKKIIILIFVFSLFVSIIPYLPNFERCSVTESISTKAEVPSIDGPTSENSSPREFQIAFPSSPSYSCQEQLLPKLSQKPIALHQYTAKDGRAEYKVYTTVLPKKCFRWSKKIILNGTLEVLTKNSRLPTKILSSTFKSGKYPVLEYTLQQKKEKIQIIGKLVLVDSSIYLIEVSIPELDLNPNSYQKIGNFIDSFDLPINLSYSKKINKNI